MVTEISCFTVSDVNREQKILAICIITELLLFLATLYAEIGLVWFVNKHKGVSCIMDGVPFQSCYFINSRTPFRLWVNVVYVLTCWKTESFLVLQMIRSAHWTTTIATKKAVWQVYSRIFLSLDETNIYQFYMKNLQEYIIWYI